MPLSQEKSVQTVYTSHNDIWVSDLGINQKNGRQIKDNSKKYGESDAWLNQKRLPN